MRGLTTLGLLLTLTLCSTARAQTVDSGTIPARPIAQFEFPRAQELTVGGTAYRCFAAEGQEWRTVAHIVVDYRAFFEWARWAEFRVRLYQTETENLNKQLAIWRETADVAMAGNDTMAAMFDQEHKLRLDLERRATSGAPAWVAWGLGGLSLAELGAIVALVAVGAAQQ